MNNKTLSIIAYITIFGWLIAYYVKKDDIDDFRKYHLEQAFAVAMFTFATYILMNFLVFFETIISIVGGIVNVVILLLIIIGVYNAYKGLKRPLPIIGKFAEEKLNFF